MEFLVIIAYLFGWFTGTIFFWYAATVILSLIDDKKHGVWLDNHRSLNLAIFTIAALFWGSMLIIIYQS